MKAIVKDERGGVEDFFVRLPGWMGRKIKQEAEAGMMSWSTRIRQIIAAHYERETEKAEV